jgi:hypothetical protein
MVTVIGSKATLARRRRAGANFGCRYAMAAIARLQHEKIKCQIPNRGTTTK